jgi:hypothetical protein
MVVASGGSPILNCLGNYSPVSLICVFDRTPKNSRPPGIREGARQASFGCFRTDMALAPKVLFWNRAGEGGYGQGHTHCIVWPFIFLG